MCINDDDEKSSQRPDTSLRAAERNMVQSRKTTKREETTLGNIHYLHTHTHESHTTTIGHQFSLKRQGKREENGAQHLCKGKNNPVQRTALLVFIGKVGGNARAR